MAVGVQSQNPISEQIPQVAQRFRRMLLDRQPSEFMQRVYINLYMLLFVYENGVHE